MNNNKDGRINQTISFEKLISLNPNEWHSIQPVWSHEY